MSIVRLGDICQFINGGAWTQSDFSNSGYPVLKVSNCKPSGFVIEDVSYLPLDVAEKSEINKLNLHDVIIATVGSHPNLVDSAAGRACVVTNEVAGYYLNQNAVCLRTFDKNVLNQRYLGFLTQYFPFQHYIQNKGKGAANQMRIAISAIKEYSFDLPNIEIQDKIADILSAYDDLIENNQKQIKLLEEAAQRLYKEWFVDLRFPGYENTPIIDGVPQGWKVIEIGTAFKTLLGGTPSREKAEYWENGTVPWINSGKVNELRVVEPSEYITDIALDKSATKLLPKHTTLVAITGATLGQVSYTEIETCANQSVVGIVDESQRYSEYVYCYVLDNIKSIIGKATGGAQQHINKDIVNSYPIILPNDDIAVKFQSVAKPIFNKISKLLFENINLTEARDRLLPKLMSGEKEV